MRVKLNYLDRATLRPLSISDDATAIAGYVVGFIKLPLVDFYDKLGAARFGSLAGRLEYERFDLGASDGVNLVSHGATRTFRWRQATYCDNCAARHTAIMTHCGAIDWRSRQPRNAHG